MSEQYILDSLDPDAAERATSRRGALFSLGRYGAMAAMASVPLGLAAMAKNAFAQTNTQATLAEILKYALTLERLEASFYIRALNMTATANMPASTINFPAGVRQVFTIIRDHEIEHVQFIENALTAAGVSFADVPNQFDFTAGGMFPDVFSNYATFVTLSTAFEDTGVRAYKGQAPALINNDDVLTMALRIHSVEARHASKVRRLSGSYPEQGWIPFTQPGAPQPVAPVYQGEAEVIHIGVNVPQVVGTGTVSEEDITEAFDEPLTMEEVRAIIRPFLPG